VAASVVPAGAEVHNTYVSGPDSCCCCPLGMCTWRGMTQTLTHCTHRLPIQPTCV
jgi:hypothetical protein